MRCEGRHKACPYRCGRGGREWCQVWAGQGRHEACPYRGAWGENEVCGLVGAGLVDEAGEGGAEG